MRASCDSVGRATDFQRADYTLIFSVFPEFCRAAREGEWCLKGDKVAKNTATDVGDARSKFRRERAGMFDSSVAASTALHSDTRGR